MKGSPAIVAEVHRPLTQPELLELAKAPLRGLPRVQADPLPEVEAPAIADAIGRCADDFQTSRLAFLAACMVEQWPGFDPEDRIAAAVLERLPPVMVGAAKASRVLVRPTRRLDFRKLVDAVGIRWNPGLPALLGAHLLCMGAMTLLASSPRMRTKARADRLLWGASRVVSETVTQAEALVMMLEALDRWELVVLYPERRTGFLVDVRRVRNGFALFALLDGLPLPADEFGPFPQGDPAVVALARGEATSVTVERITSPLGFYNWSAWTAEGLAQDRAARLIWGEHATKQIPLLEGMPIVVRGTPWLDRGWPPEVITPLHPAYLPSAALVRRLAAREYASWMRAILSATPETRQALRA